MESFRSGGGVAVRRFGARLALALVVAAALGAPHPVRGANPAGAHTAPDAGVLADFARLGDFLTPLAEGQVPRGVYRSLLRTLESAEAAYRRGRACTAGNILGALQAQARAGRATGAPQGEEIGNLVRALRGRVLAQVPATAPCAARQRVDAAPQAEVRVSDDRALEAAVTFGEARLGTVLVDGRAFTELTLPGIESQVGAPGQPGVPVWRRLIAAPRGARVDVGLVAPPAVAERLAVDLLPFQGQAVDQAAPRGEEPPPASDFADPPFALDTATYATDAAVPGFAVRVTPLGSVRDLELYRVEVPTGHYNPVRRELTLYARVEWRVTFTGGGGFLTEQALNPFERFPGGVDRAVLNADAVYQYVEPLPVRPTSCDGEELLILAHSSLMDAALRLRDHKRSRGISTNVVSVPGRATDEDIDALIEARWDCLVRPSYVLLLGDVETIPTRYDTEQDATEPPLGCSDPRAGDFAYGVIGPVYGFLPDLGVARIPVDTLAEADQVVDKVIAYETNPPAADSFYEKATFAGQFECCRHKVEPEYPFTPPSVKGPLLDAWHALHDGTSQRSYIASLEVAGDKLRSLGYEVERLYMRTTDQGDPGYSFDPNPRRYYDGTPLPAALAPGSFYWPYSPGYQDAEVTDRILTAFKSGRFLIVHRDHGWFRGWGTPRFEASDLSLLDNAGRHPFVFSINCASGAFDSETAGGECGMTAGTESFVEELLMGPKGAVAVIGDTRNSPTWENSALFLGLMDAIWPGTLPGFGDALPERRLADILGHARAYLLEVVTNDVDVPLPGGSYDASDVFYELAIWHAFGDPTLRIWSSNPKTILLDTEFDLALAPGALHVAYAVEGAEITAIQEVPGTGAVVHVGRATVRGGTATLAFVQPPLPDVPIRLSAAQEGRLTVELMGRDPTR